ncbi:hypothetical protein AMTR_s00067p00182730 [Amborella trichopoda]|uniref:Uncharacterized protein n=1 Tax=Amborella trichopoda TaxID=13333 RepID=U5DET3_AMBTC|nr:hypothetical protein AMTR_s00067p00182730 [Amborella trichopoda]
MEIGMNGVGRRSFRRCGSGDDGMMVVSEYISGVGFGMRRALNFGGGVAKDVRWGKRCFG